MTLSILFIWESCKYCTRTCCRSREPDCVRVSMVRDDEVPVERRSKRQEAVRRAIEREAGGLRFRGEAERAREEPTFPLECDVPSTMLDVSVNIRPATRTERASSSTSVQEFTQGLAPSGPGLPSSSNIPSGEVSRTPQEVRANFPSHREVSTQTEFYQGLTYQQMCDVDLLTTSSKTPSAVHLFPNCHALRNVSSVQNRSFCRYCLTSARQGL